MTITPRIARAAALLLLAQTAACSPLFEREIRPRNRADEFLAVTDVATDDPRYSALTSYARAADNMLSSPAPVADLAQDLLQRQACFWAMFGRMGADRERTLVATIADDQARLARWRQFVVIASSMPAITRPEDICAF